ncbi:MAG: YkgJ family cysteine cluster protein [Methanolinea sp.]|nr:YkgJ family cysteine cluster protein [Methanolinea sp.]
MATLIVPAVPRDREMAFSCRQCGTCCMYLGDYIVIEKETGPFEFLACCVSTGTEFVARVDDDKRELFADRSWIAAHPRACPFLRPAGEKFSCTVHGTRPAQCRAYRCVVARIRSPDGREAGYVTGTLNLHSSDPALREAWGEVERALSRDPYLSEEEIAGILRRRGYAWE